MTSPCTYIVQIVSASLVFTCDHYKTFYVVDSFGPRQASLIMRNIWRNMTPSRQSAPCVCHSLVRCSLSSSDSMSRRSLSLACTLIHHSLSSAFHRNLSSYPYVLLANNRFLNTTKQTLVSVGMLSGSGSEPTSLDGTKIELWESPEQRWGRWPTAVRVKSNP